MTIVEFLICGGLASVSGVLMHRLRGHPRLTADEGYLWYGALQVREGAMPIRDFRAYEPGRYWWTAGLMSVLGTGVGAVRMSALIFYVGAMVAALHGLQRVGFDPISLGLCAVLLAAWSDPVYKLYEPALLLYGFCAAVIVVLDPSPGSAGMAGFVVGIAAVFGLNYGLYLSIGLSFVALAVLLKAPVPDPGMMVLAGIGGVALGSAPLWIPLIWSSTFRAAILERRVRTPIRRGTTNLPLPVPKLWAPTPPMWRHYGGAGGIVGALLFIAMPALGISALAGLAISPWPAITLHAGWLASGALLVAAQHHAYSRADLLHLCQTMPLLVVCALAVASLAGEAATYIVSLMLVAAAVVFAQTGLKRKLAHVLAIAPAPLLPKSRGRLIDELRRLRAHHLRPDETVLALPRLVDLFPVLGLRSPVYDTYCVYPSSDEDQARMLDEIGRSGVRLAVVEDHPLDGREELRFSRTHPRVWAHLHQRFEKLPMIAELPEFSFFLRRDPASDAP